ncbi:MAG: hypothetical protein N2C14_21455 [Planctomycetales bacterium]
MAQAAVQNHIEPRTISFKGTMQTLEAFQFLIDFQGRLGRSFRLELYQQVLTAIVRHRVANRPDRYEPRFKKRRARLYSTLTVPRHEAKLAILKGRMKN